MNHEEKRILSVDPTTRGFGFAVMEGPEKLIDWGVKGAKKRKNESCLDLLCGLMDRYSPDVVVVEDFSAKGSRRCHRVQSLICQIAKLAESRRIRVQFISRKKVRKTFSESGKANKYNISRAIAQKLPELAPRLPPYRKCWMSEDYRMSIFDAVSFVMAFFYFEK